MPGKQRRLPLSHFVLVLLALGSMVSLLAWNVSLRVASHPLSGSKAKVRHTVIPVQHTRWTHVPHEVLAFYYGWYGTPQVSGHWIHWSDVDLSHSHIGSVTHYPADGPYDSNDPSVVERQCELAR